MGKLDLKYRPRRFSEVLGNAGILRLLLSRSRSGSLGDQSMMFGGPKGCGKTTMARIVARAMLCRDLDDGEPCGTCHMCTSILDDTCPSVEEMDAASQGTVERIRSMVADADYGTVDGSDHRVYIIDEAQRLSKAAQDALLKSVEGRFFTVILCTTEPQNIKGPIRNRMEEYPVRPPEAEELVAHLARVCEKESIRADAPGLELIVTMNGRTPRSCLLSVSSLASLGPITAESVREYFRFDSFTLVDRVLCLLDSDPVTAFSSLDDLSSRESPAWIRDAVVLAISSGLRADVGARSTYPVDSRSFPVRGRGWLPLAHRLGRIDRPSMADIEAALMSEAPPELGGRVQLGPPPSPPLPSPPPAPESTASPSGAAEPPKLPPVPEPPPDPDPPAEPVRVEPASPGKELEIDGVTFSARENLTTLDGKISSSSGLDKPEADRSTPVELDGSRAPIPEKEFASEFIGRFHGLRGPK